MSTRPHRLGNAPRPTETLLSARLGLVRASDHMPLGLFQEPSSAPLGDECYTGVPAGMQPHLRVRRARARQTMRRKPKSSQYHGWPSAFSVANGDRRALSRAEGVCPISSYRICHGVTPRSVGWASRAAIVTPRVALGAERWSKERSRRAFERAPSLRWGRC